MIPELRRFRAVERWCLMHARFAVDWLDDRLHSWEVNFRESSRQDPPRPSDARAAGDRDESDDRLAARWKQVRWDRHRKVSRDLPREDSKL